jgi:hypothetical protein
MKKRQRVHGTGSVFKRGRVWWYSFNRNKLEYRESALTDIKTVAISKLKARIQEIDSLGIAKNDFTVGDLMASVFLDYQNHGQRSIDDAKERWKLHLAPVFEYVRARHVTTDMLDRYVAQRDSEKAALATVNRELALLRRAFNLGKGSTPPKVVLRAEVSHPQRTEHADGISRGRAVRQAGCGLHEARALVAHDARGWLSIRMARG